MPDDNRFQGIGDALDEDDADDEPDDDATDDPEPVQETQPDPTTELESPDEQDDESAPAFPYEATVQKSVYVLPDAWNDLDGAMSLAEAKLKTEDGETDVTTSELHTALARLGAENPEELRRLVYEAREE